MWSRGCVLDSDLLQVGTEICPEGLDLLAGGIQDMIIIFRRVQCECVCHRNASCSEAAKCIRVDCMSPSSGLVLFFSAPTARKRMSQSENQRAAVVV